MISPPFVAPGRSPQRGDLMSAEQLAHAASVRDLVMVPDGRTGRLIYVGPNSRKAKVLVQGQHLRLPADHLIIFTEKES